MAVMILRCLGFLAVLGAADAHVAIRAQSIAGVPVTSSDVDYEADELETTPEPTCPSNFSTGPDMHGDCKCNDGLDCYYQGVKGTCPHTWHVNSSTWFSLTCVDCICLEPPPTPAPEPTPPPTPETTPAPTPEPSCPSNFSTGPDMHGDCKCNDGLDCYYQGVWGTCPHTWHVNSSSWFSWTCVDCICQAPPPTPAPVPTPPTPETTPAPTPEPSCPSEFSTGPDMHGDCKCNDGLDCYYQGVWGTCPHAWHVNSSSWFSWTCQECKCQAEGTETPAPTPVLPTPAPASGLSPAMWGFIGVLAFGGIGLGVYAWRRRNSRFILVELV